MGATDTLILQGESPEHTSKREVQVKGKVVFCEEKLKEVIRKQSADI